MQTMRIGSKTDESPVNAGVSAAGGGNSRFWTRSGALHGKRHPVASFWVGDGPGSAFSFAASGMKGGIADT